MKRVVMMLLAAAVLASPGSAFDLGGNNVLIPVVGRVPGGFGTEWRTDLVVSNLEPASVSVFLTLYSDGGESFTDLQLPAYGTVSIRDVIQARFDASTALGMLRVSSANTSARLVARAYIYNSGNPAGEFGQGVTGLPVDSLTQDHVLPGISASPASNTRTNLGIANPWPTEVSVLLTLHSGGGQVLGNLPLTIAATSVTQITDVVVAFGRTELDGGSIRVAASAPVYPYASVVRNDTGDASFAIGSGVRVQQTGTAAACTDPAPLIFPPRNAEPADPSFVVLHPGTDRSHVESVVAPRHGVQILEYNPAVPGFYASLGAEQTAGLRCEGVVRAIRRDGAAAAP